MIMINKMNEGKTSDTRSRRRSRRKSCGVPKPSPSITSPFFTSMFSPPSPPPSPRSLALLQSHQPSSFSFSSSSLSPPRILQHIKYSRPALLRPSSRVLLPDASFSALHLSSLRAGLSLPFLHNARTTVSTRHAKSPCLHDLL